MSLSRFERQGCEVIHCKTAKPRSMHPFLQEDMHDSDRQATCGVFSPNLAGGERTRSNCVVVFPLLTHPSWRAKTSGLQRRAECDSASGRNPRGLSNRMQYALHSDRCARMVDPVGRMNSFHASSVGALAHSCSNASVACFIVTTRRIPRAKAHKGVVSPPKKQTSPITLRSAPST